ncbi:MAG: hypothetical protein GY898_02860 [Proteobacteria bacterium]|nr:hypothetical protein [Pseudomonadota bacterium]
MLHIRHLFLTLTAASALALTGCGCNEPPPEEEPPSEAPTPEPQYNRGYYLDMDLDSQGRIWLAFQDRDNTALTLARGTGSPVELEVFAVEGQGEVISGLLTGNFDGGNYATVAVDSNDVPHAAHYDRENDRLRYAVKAGDEWDTANVANGTGQFASLGLIGGSDPIIAHYDGEALQVSWLDGGSWSTEEVDAGTPGAGDDDDAPEANAGKYSDLMVASDGTVYIAYLDVTNGDLKVASGGPGAWNVAAWHSEGSVGAWPSLAENNGTIYVAFQDLENHDLVLGTWTGSALDVEIVDEGDFVGADSAIAWSGETMVIAYHDGVNNDALLATNDGSGWVLGTQMADGAVGFYNSLAGSDGGQLTWSCFDHTTTDIQIQRFSL